MFGFWSRCQGKCRGDAPDEWDWAQPRGRISSISGEPSGEPISGEPAARNLPTDGLGRILDSAGIPWQIPRPPPFEEGWGGVTREEYDERVRRCVLLCNVPPPNVPPPAVYQQVEGYGVYAGVYQQGGYDQGKGYGGYDPGKGKGYGGYDPGKGKGYGGYDPGKGKGYAGERAPGAIVQRAPGGPWLRLDDGGYDQGKGYGGYDQGKGYGGYDPGKGKGYGGYGPGKGKGYGERAPAAVPDTPGAATAAARRGLDEATATLARATAAARRALDEFATAELAEAGGEAAANPYYWSGFEAAAAGVRTSISNF